MCLCVWSMEKRERQVVFLFKIKRRGSNNYSSDEKKVLRFFEKGRRGLRKGNADF